MRSAAGLRVQSAGCYGITGRAREWNGHADIPDRIPPKDSLILTIIFNGPTFHTFSQSVPQPSIGSSAGDQSVAMPLSLGRQHIFGTRPEDLSQKADYVGNRGLLVNVAK
jgi:hypothetical protein